jgi:uncharacterized membrane protein YoaK (UPF0700 family)
MQRWQPAPNDAGALSRWESWLPTVLSVIAGMVDLLGFLTLGTIFTAHITGNLVLIAAAVVRDGPLNPIQALAIPAFILAIAAAWLLARVSGQHGRPLARLLLRSQFLLLAGGFVFNVIAQPSAHPHGVMAGIAVLIAVAAMACQYTLMRLTIPDVPLTGVMTSNLTNAVLSLLDTVAPIPPARAETAERLRTTLHLLIGFLVGCVVAAVAVPLLGEWAWSLPAVLAGLAAIMR